MSPLSENEWKRFLSIEDIKVIVKSALDEQTFDLKNYEVFSLSGESVGFMGAHYRLILTVSTRSSANKVLSFFVKTLPASIAHRTYIINLGLFRKEVVVYKALLPRIIHLSSDSENVCFAKCFLSNDNVLVFEDLQEKGYVNAPTISGQLDVDHIIIALQTLAKFHACSIIIERQVILQGSLDPFPLCYKDCLFESRYNMNEPSPRRKFMDSAISALVKISENLVGTQINEGEFHTLKSLLPGVVLSVCDLVKPSRRFRNVFVHGDLWANNLMYRYDPSGRPNHCILVDFQIMRFAPPATDIVSLIYMATDKKFRDGNFGRLLSIYYASLCSELAKANIAVEDDMSWTTFIESIEFYRIVGIIESCLFGIINSLPSAHVAAVLSNPDDYIKVITEDRTKLILRGFDSDTFYREKVSENLCELISYILKTVK